MEANEAPLCEQEQEIMTMGHTMRLSSCVYREILSATKTDLLFLNVET